MYATMPMCTGCLGYGRPQLPVLTDAAVPEHYVGRLTAGPGLDAFETVFEIVFDINERLCRNDHKSRFGFIHSIDTLT
jgi:hypothetical protein